MAISGGAMAGIDDAFVAALTVDGGFRMQGSL